MTLCMKKKDDYLAPEALTTMAVSGALICASPLGIDGSRDDYDTSDNELYL